VKNPSRVVAIDVGGTDTKAAVVGAGGAVLASRSLPTPRAGPETGERVIDLVVQLVEEFGAGSAAVGLVVPGLVDERRGVGVSSENLDWRDVPFVDAIQERCGLPTVLGHDVRAGGLAESRLGAARGVRDALFMPIGTGIAAAVILGGRLHAADGYAGEIGHTDVGHDEPCACGRRGCLEAIASAAAIARRYAERTRRAATAQQVVAAAQAGDPVAIAVWDDALDALAASLAWVASVLAPEVVVIGGGLSRAGGALLDPLAERLGQRLTFIQRTPRLVPAELGDRAGCLGAALLAFERLTRR
jgi:glucokinase